MNLEKLVEIKLSIIEELELYESLSELYEEKRKALISNKSETLLNVDDKILNVIDSLKSAVNHRLIITEHKNINLSELIKISAEINKELSEEFEELQTKTKTLIEKISQQENVIKELLKHGLTLVNKTLNLFTSATPIAGDYNNLGKNDNSKIGKISSIIEEV